MEDWAGHFLQVSGMEDLYAHVVVDDLIQSAIKEETRQLAAYKSHGPLGQTSISYTFRYSSWPCEDVKAVQEEILLFDSEAHGFRYAALCLKRTN